jgi:hypothetical protein
MFGELSRVLTDLVKQNFPEIESVFRYHVKARVISTDRDKGVATVHPLRPDGSLDNESPEIPNVPLPQIPAPDGSAYVVPLEGELVRLCYYYDDPSQPKVVECLGRGYIYGDMLWESRRNAHIEMKGRNIDIG